MKKLLLALMAFVFVASASLAQPSTSVKKRTKARTTAHKTKKTQTVKPVDTNTAEEMRTPQSGMKSNGAGKTAKIQTTTKEKNDNLNDMDESRN